MSFIGPPAVFYFLGVFHHWWAVAIWIVGLGVLLLMAWQEPRLQDPVRSKYQVLAQHSPVRRTTHDSALKDVRAEHIAALGEAQVKYDAALREKQRERLRTLIFMSRDWQKRAWLLEEPRTQPDDLASLRAQFEALRDQAVNVIRSLNNPDLADEVSRLSIPATFDHRNTYARFAEIEDMCRRELGEWGTPLAGESE